MIDDMEARCLACEFWFGVHLRVNGNPMLAKCVGDKPDESFATQGIPAKRADGVRGHQVIVIPVQLCLRGVLERRSGVQF